MNTKRILLGLAAAVLFGLAAGELISLANLPASPVLQSVAVSFFGAVVGAWVARTGFLFPALGLWLVEWLAGLYVVYWIAEPTGQASIMAITQLNLASILLSALAVALGVLVGQVLATRTRQPASAI